MARIVSHTISVDKARVSVGEPVRVTGVVELDQAAEAEIAGTLYVNGVPARDFTARVEGDRAEYVLELVFREPGRHRLQAYAELRGLPYRAIVEVPGRLNGVVVVDSSTGEQLVFSDEGRVSRSRWIELVYTAVGYPVDRTVCSRVEAYMDSDRVYSGELCAAPETRQTVQLPVRSARTLRIVAAPHDSDVAGDEMSLGILDVAAMTAEVVEVKDPVIRIRVSGLPEIGGGYWYRIIVGKRDKDLGFIELGHVDTRGGQVEVEITRSSSQGCVCVDTIRVRLCNKSWVHECTALLKEIELPHTCIGPLCRW